MCCGTHHIRDNIALAAGEVVTRAEAPEFRCQCNFGGQCERRATGEDFRCDWCRQFDHEAFCRMYNNGMYVPNEPSPMSSSWPPASSYISSNYTPPQPAFDQISLGGQEIKFTPEFNREALRDAIRKMEKKPWPPSQ